MDMSLDTTQPLSQVVRDGLFLAASRTYAEQYIEPLIRAKYGFREPTWGDHDAVDDDGRKYEIKACKVLRASVNRKGSKSLLERVIYETTNVPTNRLVPFAEAEVASYDANVQNVKRDHFDTLIYVLLFGDCAKIFFADNHDIILGSFRGWSDKHGRYDAVGKSGQFAVNKGTVRWHIERHLRDTVTYQEMADTYSKLSE
jgi:hypothetical protein